MNKVEVLDATLRDGSYIVNDQFTIEDTAFFVQSLEEIGFKFIEIGPGIGMNAKANLTISPAAEDIEYIRAARKVAKKSKIGMFFIPGIGRKEDIYMAAHEGLDFLRIGIDVNRYDEVIEYVELAKSLQLTTAVNLMKSYAISPKQFAEIGAKLNKNGVDLLYLVDSAGGMLPKCVGEYISETKKAAPNLKLGFHGHDNLALAVANTLAAIEHGADFVDTTIRGIGRSSGNTNGEKLVFALDRLGYQHDFNIDKLLHFSEKIVLPFLKNKSETSTDYILGYSQFHSSYLNSIKKYSKLYNVDANHLIIEYSKIDKISMDENILEEIAKQLDEKHTESSVFNYTMDINFSADREEQLLLLKNKFIELKNKYNNKIYFNIAKNYEKEIDINLSPAIHSVEDIVFGSAEIDSNKTDLMYICNYFYDVVDGFFIDQRILDNIDNYTIDGKDFFIYNDAVLFARTITNYLKWITPKESAKYVYLDIYKEIYPQLNKNDHRIIIVDSIEKADIAVLGRNYITSKDINVENLKWIIVTTPGKIDNEITLKSNINLIRLDLQREIYKEIIENIHYKSLFEKEYGHKTIEGKHYCSGGYIGEKGTIIVDDINDIKKVYGISNGDGSIQYKKK